MDFIKIITFFVRMVFKQKYHSNLQILPDLACRFLYTLYNIVNIRVNSDDFNRHTLDIETTVIIYLELLFIHKMYNMI